MQHQLTLVQEEEGLYECEICGKRGFNRDFLGDICPGVSGPATSTTVTYDPDDVSSMSRITLDIEGSIDAA
jgi:hypothetical protein